MRHPVENHGVHKTVASKAGNEPLRHKSTSERNDVDTAVVSKCSLSPLCNQRVVRVSSDVSAGLDDLVIECDDVFYDPQDAKSKRSSVRLTLKPPAMDSDGTIGKPH